METQIVIFELGEEYYGVNIATVESIIKPQAITKMPQAPAFVEGITNLRGQVIPVIDLRKRFALSTVEETKDTRIIVVAIETVTAGIIVDAVTEVLRVSDDAIELTPAMVSAVDAAFITGIAKVGDQLIVLLDLSKILNLEEKVHLQEAVA